MTAWRPRLGVAEQLDAASLGLFRIALGAMGALAALRFFTHGWIDKYYVEPHIFFSYWGFSWIRPWPAPWMHVHYAVIFLSAVLVALGVWTRVACGVLALTFGYAHFCDQTNYLNHYYLFTLLALLGTVLPLDRYAALRPAAFTRVIGSSPAYRPTPTTVPAWAVGLVRFQLGVVYVFGALGKIGGDWLLHGQPLRIWLAANAELPVLGRFFHLRATALAFSWAGFLFDLTIVGFLSWRRTRAPAYAALVVFHVLTALLFRIGLFPWMMIAFAPIFFDPSWPRRGRPPPAPSAASTAPSSLGLAAAGLYAFVQLAMPLRSHLYPGNVLWSEEGFRFSWKVMLIEKVGDLELAIDDATGARSYVEARDRLTPIQLRMVSTQPDMILQFAHVVAAEYAARGLGPVRVSARSHVSFNGRPHAPLVDPDCDLAALRDTLAPKLWITPGPAEPLAF